jgi:hypothetical protein
MRRTLFALAALSICLATTASAASFRTTVKQNARVSLTATPSGCENNPGPYITLNGEIGLSGVTARIILTNNAKFTHVASGDVSADVVLIPAGESIRIAKQPSRGGVGGNPWIYFQYTDCKGGTIGAPIKLGRCVQGLGNVNGNFPIPTAIAAALTGGCSNNPGPFITLGGDLRMGGLCGQIIFTNNAKFTHVASEDVCIDVTLLEDGKTLTFAKQPPLGGAGGNPHIWVEFLDGSGHDLCDPIYVGRCVQL